MDPSFVESLPEAFSIEAILTEFLDAARKAKDVFDVNVAAGIAWAKLKGLDD